MDVPGLQRPRQRWTALSFYLRRPSSHRTIVRKVVRDGERYLHVA
jgi:hypothetical protein